MTAEQYRNWIAHLTRMWRKAGVPCCLLSRDEYELMRVCAAKDADAYDEFIDRYCESGDRFEERLKAFARSIGVKHWRLRD